ncbi:hypothetical protein DENSPDRAFT_784008 [Dentipellis sp. KUC8613]|nr:hypothetical protein DENSPDRAFT_784008 [Dentipellis sp. KUC8613]
MKARTLLAFLGFAASSVARPSSFDPPQALFSAYRGINATQPGLEWDVPADPDGTANLIFNSVSAVMQKWPNTQFRNGHSIVTATIPAGTILYHGRTDEAVPTQPDWLAFDFEHAYIFCRSYCFVLSMVSTRELRLAYFDGASAGKTLTGTMDSQDLLIWGRVEPEKWMADGERIRALCEWGKQFGLDGFVRMEFHFEVMLCDFSDGMDVVSLLNLVPIHQPWPRRRPGEDPHDSGLHGLKPPRGPMPPPPGEGPDPRRPPHFPEKPPPPPEGWRGSLPDSDAQMFEALHAGAWHDRAPGETRVHIDYSGFVTFYDDTLSSLVAARRGKTHLQHRLEDISEHDLGRVIDELEEVLARNTSVAGSRVDWGSITRVIIEHHGTRLEIMKHLLETDEFHNATKQAGMVRAQLLIALAPYIGVDAVPAPGTSPTANTSWAAPIMHYCSKTQTSLIRDELLTKQERRIRDAVDGTLHEICRVLTKMWVGAFAIEEAGENEVQNALQDWRELLGGLMAWLDWSDWTRCNPGCGPDSICYIPTWPFYLDKDPNNMTPRCIRRYAPYPTGRE